MHVNGQKGWSPVIVIQLHASTWNQDEGAFRHPSVFEAISPLQVWWRQQLRAARNAGLAKKRSREVVADRDVMDEGTAQVPGFVSGWDGPEPQVTLELQNKSGSPARLNNIQISSSNPLLTLTGWPQHSTTTVSCDQLGIPLGHGSHHDSSLLPGSNAQRRGCWGCRGRCSCYSQPGGERVEPSREPWWHWESWRKILGKISMYMYKVYILYILEFNRITELLYRFRL